MDAAAGSHNKHFSEVIFDRRRARTHRMPASVFRCGPSEDGVQRGPRSRCAGRGAWGEGWKGSRGAPGQLCFQHLHAAVRGFLPRAATVIFFDLNLPPSHHAVTLTLPSRAASPVPTRAVATLYCFTRACPSTRRPSPIN